MTSFSINHFDYSFKMSIHSLIRKGREHLKLSEEAFAKLLDVSRGTVQQWEKEGGTAPNRKRQPAVAALLGISVSQLMSGIEGQANTEALPHMGKVPLIDWVAAGDFCGINDPYPIGMAEDWLYCPTRHGSKTYALRVRGESMFNPSGSPSFKDGDIIFIDPDRTPNHKSLVICRLDDNIETTFKRLLVEGDTKMLEALNPSWPERIIKVNDNATICGVVIGRFDSF